MSFGSSTVQYKVNGGTDTFRGIEGQPHLAGNLICRNKPDPENLLRQQVRVLVEQGQRAGAIMPEKPHGQRWADLVVL